jgi:hypothetical protein
MQKPIRKIVQALKNSSWRMCLPDFKISECHINHVEDESSFFIW